MSRSPLGWVKALARGWTEFWVPASTGASAGLLRVAVGLVALWNAVAVCANFDRYFSDSGMMPWAQLEGRVASKWTLFAIAPTNDAWGWTLAAAQVVVAVTLLIGALPRASAAAAWILALSFAWRNQYLPNGGDMLLGILLFLLIFAPIDRQLVVYVPRWRRRQMRRFPANGLVLRVISIQFAWVYFVTGLHKLWSPAWQEGYAMRLVLRHTAFARWPTDIDSVVLTLSTWAILAFEVLFPLVFVPRLRRYFLIAGLVFHAGIEATMLIPTFSVMMAVSYLAFVPDAVSQPWIDAVRRRLATS
ncbi:MAG: hypothetical protein B7733_06800 [Myxococcales bacterium FL481]|nr:MAG: hypothetical protein B7733_06800 [Myxococcales bacterium FL481]